MIRSYTIAAALAASATAASAATVQQAAPPAQPAQQAQQAQPRAHSATDTVLWAEIGAGARAKTVELQAGQPAENQRVAAQYRESLGQIERGQFDSAEVTLQAILIRSANNPLYQGEFAYVMARSGGFENAGNVYTRAYQLLQQNTWFLAGLALARSGHGQYADAAGTIQLAAQTDSAVITGRLTSAAAGWFEQAGDRGNALVWARLATVRDPANAQNWLRIASYLRARNDSTPEGMAAIRRYRTMKPDDQLGAALYADYLYTADQVDSALALITFAAQDSAYREFAGQLHMQAGRDYVQRRDPDAAIRVLTAGYRYATPEQRPVFSNVMGRAQLMKVNTALEETTQNRACSVARLADSLLTESERNLRAGASFDSTRTASILEGIVPAYKNNAQNAVRNCRDTPPPPARRPARPATTRP